MRIVIEGTDLPGLGCAGSPDKPGGYWNIHVAVQGKKRDDLVGLIRADAGSATWALEVRTAAGHDFGGPCVQGRPGARFVYLTWGVVDDGGGFEMFRRAKLSLEAVPAETLDRAVAQGRLVGRLGLSDEKGNPVCGSVRPPQIVWSAG